MFGYANQLLYYLPLICVSIRLRLIVNVIMATDEETRAIDVSRVVSGALAIKTHVVTYS